MLQKVIHPLLVVYISLFSSYTTGDTSSTENAFDLLANKDNDEFLSVSTYNVWGLPVSLKGHNQKERFDKLPFAIENIDQDVICLQEVFHPDLSSRLVHDLSDTYFLGQDYSCRESHVFGLVEKDCYGGLMTLSKFPIVYERFYPYSSDNSYSIVERVGSKGFLFTTIIREGAAINIINTHLYANKTRKAENIRMKQILEMQRILESIPNYNLFPSLLVGDLNINHPSVSSRNEEWIHSDVYAYIVDTLHFTDSKQILDEGDYTIDYYSNPKYVKQGDHGQKLDYIMIHNIDDGSKTIKAACQSRIFDEEDNKLSDHLGWSVDIMF